MVSNVRLIILGSGTSAGVPVIGCDCAVCTSDDARDRRTRCAACLRFTDSAGVERVILIDASPDLREQVLRQKLARCDAILFTHNHVDHTFGLDDVRRFNALMHAPIPIHADARTLEHLQRVYRHIFEQHKNVNDSFVATLIPHVIDAGSAVDVHGLRFTAVRLLHGRLPVLGFRIEAVNDDGAVVMQQPGPLPAAYCTDVSAIPPETWPRLTGLRTLVLDMLRFRKHPTHFSVDEAVAAAANIGAQQTFFTHMTHDISHAELDPDLPPGMRLAYDGLVLDGTPAMPPREPSVRPQQIEAGSS
jgi:phosphoribosyl 1,2-cyclic phosphate phosphodiesterase